MAKKAKTVEAYSDVKELNWECEEDKGTKVPSAGSEEPDKGTKVPLSGLDEIPEEQLLKQSLYDYWQQVDPEIREENPVWHWCLADDHCTFVFKDGRKVVMPL